MWSWGIETSHKSSQWESVIFWGDNRCRPRHEHILNTHESVSVTPPSDCAEVVVCIVTVPAATWGGCMTRLLRGFPAYTWDVHTLPVLCHNRWHLVFRNSVYDEHQHRRSELEHCFCRIYHEEDKDSSMDKHIVQQIYNEFPKLFSIDALWLSVNLLNVSRGKQR